MAGRSRECRLRYEQHCSSTLKRTNAEIDMPKTLKANYFRSSLRSCRHPLDTLLCTSDLIIMHPQYFSGKWHHRHALMKRRCHLPGSSRSRSYRQQSNMASATTATPRHQPSDRLRIQIFKPHSSKATEAHGYTSIQQDGKSSCTSGNR